MTASAVAVNADPGDTAGSSGSAGCVSDARSDAPSDDVERLRLEVLRSFGVLDTPAETEFDELCELAAEITGAAAARVNLVDADRVWAFSMCGPGDRTLAREVSVCRHVVEQADTLVVADLAADPRFADLPIVAGDPHYRFYAGVPLQPDGCTVLGSLCVADFVPRTLTSAQLRQLERIARQVSAQLRRRRLALDLAAEVAARRAAEASRDAHRRLLDGVLDNSDSMIYAKDLSGRFLFANRALERLVRAGGPAAGRPVAGRSETELFPATADAYHRHDIEVAAGGQAQTFREEVQTPAGPRRYQSHKFPLVDEHGRVWAVAGVSTDVTELENERRRHAEAEQRWLQLFERSPVGVALIDEDGRWLAVNPAFCALVARGEDELVGRSAVDVLHPEDRPHARRLPERIRASADGVVRTHRRVVRPGGEVRWVETTVNHLPGPDGTSHTLAHCQDVTERVEAERARQQTEADLDAVARVTRQIQSGADARQSIVDAVGQLAHADVVSLLEPAGGDLRVTTTTAGDLRHQTVSPTDDSVAHLVACTAVEQFLPDLAGATGVPAELHRRIGGGSMYVLPIRTATHGPASVLVAGWTRPVADLDDRRAAVVRLLADQAAVALRQAALLAELETLASTDPLTALANRRRWDQELGTLFGQARRSGAPLTVALLDLDHFKRFNDTRGHAAGDRHLAAFAAAARAAVRGDDLVARWGGEEFAVALPNCPAQHGEAVLERIRATVPHGQTCSIGYATWDGTESADELIGRADRALYAAKGAGRDQVRAA
ncbi:sensor domain-containing diguanylate cyclase [Nakamurella endophytica]|uniref:PAS domain S-box-containing protein/diguanylate cyclase (GGDEF)-like protein n=1 Tax=Nakamurella endophytica TaxID=1748367 RepID=A0A917SXP4_9ACTN|nr:diguanylate cyclase [Nakamurella endophytica]GGL99967.1 hypothetical protein GCM10011594_19990 [Nakamurella endophytica]